MAKDGESRSLSSKKLFFCALFPNGNFGQLFQLLGKGQQDQRGEDVEEAVYYSDADGRYRLVDKIEMEERVESVEARKGR